MILKNIDSMEVLFMIFNLKDMDMNNYVSWVYNTLIEKITGNTNRLEVIEKKITDTGWIDLVLAGNVTPYTDGYNIQVRRIGNVVYYRGRIGNVTANDTLISVIPANFRPSDNYTFRFVCPSNGSTNAKIAITPVSGNMILEFSSDGQYPADRWISLNNICYAI